MAGYQVGKVQMVFSLSNDQQVSSKQELYAFVHWFSPISNPVTHICWKWEENPGREFCVNYPASYQGSEYEERPSLKVLAAYVLGVQWIVLMKEAWLKALATPFNEWNFQTQPNMALVVWKMCKNSLM